MHKLTVLDNGLKVITSRMADVHSLTVGLWIKTGGRYESAKTQGISHFVEHMLFKGTKRRSCQQLKRGIEDKGGIFNGFTAEEFVCYYVKILSKNLRLASDILSDMVLNPSLKPKDIEKERAVISEEIRMYLDLPMQHVQDLLDELIWPQHPLGMSLLGTYETIGSINRQDFIRHKDKFHVPNNIIATACGNIKHEAFLDMMTHMFKGSRSAKPASFKKVSASRLKLRTNFYHKDTEQTHLCLGARALSRSHPLRYALSLLNIILGGNMSSRLFNEIREKRSLAYEIGSSLKQYSDTGSFFIHAGIDNRKVDDAISIMISELGKTKKSFVTKRELNMAKEYYRSGLFMALEDTMANMLFLGEQAAGSGKIRTKEEILGDIEKVDADMIKDVANKVFVDKNLKLAMIGPQQQEGKKKIEGLLHL
ncbi:MAG: pitrilysin family protein [Candidatus Omnitrophota bacterium]